MKRKILFISVLASVFGLLASGTAFPSAERASAKIKQSQDIAITLEQVASGLSSALYVTHARDGSGRLFIVEQGGRIRIFQNGALLPTPFLTISSKLIAGGERGLLGLAFHPDFKQNRRFFVNYTRQPDAATVIAEYQASAGNPNVADTDERILLTFSQPFPNHNGGMLEFGPDGFLYIASGDGGSAGDPQNNGQNRESLLGKILRIDVDGGTPYAIPSDNPFAGALAGRDEIYATGLRNPWRFSFDRKTGDLYAGDVGQNKTEEIDLVVKGGNYGWRLMEGTSCFNPTTNCNQAGLILPIVEYDHGQGCSVTGGYVYRGKRHPALDGMYLYGDYCSGVIWGFRDGKVTVLLRSRLAITSFGEDEDGEVYVVAANGTISRVVGPASNCSMTCRGNVTVTDADGDGAEVVNYEPPVSIGLCTGGCTPPPGSRFPVGVTTVTCATADGQAQCSFTVTVVANTDTDKVPPTVRVIAPNGGESVKLGDTFTITWQSSDDKGVTSHNLGYENELSAAPAPIPIVSGLAGSAQSFAWKIETAAVIERARLRVLAADAAGNIGFDISDAPFSINVSAPADTTPPAVRVTAPNGGEKLKAGNTFLVQWQSSDNVGVARHDVLLSTDGGATFPTALASGLAGTIQSFGYAVPTTQSKSKTARIRVVAVDASGNRGQDDSDANFVLKKRK